MHEEIFLSPQHVRKKPSNFFRNSIILNLKHWFFSLIFLLLHVFLALFGEIKIGNPISSPCPSLGVCGILLVSDVKQFETKGYEPQQVPPDVYIGKPRARSVQWLALGHSLEPGSPGSQATSVPDSCAVSEARGSCFSSSVPNPTVGSWVAH